MAYQVCFHCGAFRDDLIYFFNGSWICNDCFERLQIDVSDALKWVIND